MAQYRESMGRMFGMGKINKISPSLVSDLHDLDVKAEISGDQTIRNQITYVLPKEGIISNTVNPPDFSAIILNDEEEEGGNELITNAIGYMHSQMLTCLNETSTPLLDFILPVCWLILFVGCMDRTSVLSLLYLPFLGLFSALLANAIPIGGGVVFIPAFYLLGIDIYLGVSFTLATMSVGNGIFGFLRWCSKDNQLFLWESFLYTIPCNWLGSVIAICFMPRPSLLIIKLLFACLCLLLSILVYFASTQGGIAGVLTTLQNQSNQVSKYSYFPVDSDSISNINTTSNNDKSTSPRLWKAPLCIVSFLTGLFLVPNIGIGPALTTYIFLELSGFESERAIVTGVITGGWVCLLPFLIHLTYFQDVPIRMWIMVLPGIYYGAKHAHLVHEYLGIRRVLLGFAWFLVLNALLFFLP